MTERKAWCAQCDDWHDAVKIGPMTLVPCPKMPPNCVMPNRKWEMMPPKPRIVRIETKSADPMEK